MADAGETEKWHALNEAYFAGPAKAIYIFPILWGFYMIYHFITTIRYKDVTEAALASEYRRHIGIGIGFSILSDIYMLCNSGLSALFFFFLAQINYIVSFAARRTNREMILTQILTQVWSSIFIVAAHAMFVNYFLMSNEVSLCLDTYMKLKIVAVVMNISLSFTTVHHAFENFRRRTNSRSSMSRTFALSGAILLLTTCFIRFYCDFYVIKRMCYFGQFCIAMSAIEYY